MYKCLRFHGHSRPTFSLSLKNWRCNFFPNFSSSYVSCPQWKSICCDSAFSCFTFLLMFSVFSGEESTISICILPGRVVLLLFWGQGNNPWRNSWSLFSCFGELTRDGFKPAYWGFDIGGCVWCERILEVQVVDKYDTWKFANTVFWIQVAENVSEKQVLGLLWKTMAQIRVML
jgi:hypothetical protein